MPTYTLEHVQIGFVLSCAAVVFLMQAGFCLLESGLVRSKNSINVAAKNVLDCSLSMLLFATVGCSVMFGTSIAGWAGVPFSIDFTSDPKLLAFMLFQLVFCSTATTIVSGAVAERIRLSTYLLIALVVSAVVYPLFGHWAWGGMIEGTGQGWLAQLGFMDWAGGSVVHIVGGFAALAAVHCIGSRIGLKNKNVTGGYSLTLAILGCFLLWFGWWGFNGGSGLAISESLPKIILTTNAGAICGGLAATIYSMKKDYRIDVVDLVCGVLAGLVAVTPSCNIISFSSACLIGAVGSLLAVKSSEILKQLDVDDAVGAFQVHGVAGVWGVIALGFFANEVDLVAGSRLLQIGVQSLGALVAASFSYVTVFGCLKVIGSFMPLRVTEEEERVGLNVVEHGASNDVTDLLIEINNHSQTGDFSKDIEADQHTETGQIAAQYNKVIRRVRGEIDQHQQTNQWLEGERLRMKSVLDHAGVGIYQLDTDGVFTSANPTLLELLGQPSLEALTEAQQIVAQEKQQGKRRLLPWHTAEQLQGEALLEAFESGMPIKEVESCLLTQQGNQNWVLESLVPVRDMDGKLLSWLGTVHDISEQKRSALAEIEIAKAKSDAKGEFLASMSHEIRTPLNGVIGMLDLLDAASLPPKEQNFISIAKNSASSLLSLINDILDFSKIESGHMELENIQFPVRDLVEQTAEQFAYHAHAKKLEINCQIAADIPCLLNGDPERLRQVITNLLANAIKFTEKGEVNLRVTRVNKIMRISVLDTGIGMEESTVDSLFQSFTQADASTTRKYGGTGLGLAISSQLVRLMGGRIHVESTPDVGSEFWFELEMNIASEDAPCGQENQNRLGDLANKRVLILDDNSTNCEILANQFEGWGLAVSVCKESTSAVDRMLVAKQIGQPFDLLILDYCMPEMNGREVAVAMRRHRELRNIKTIMLSSNYEPLSRQEMEEIGIHSSITKPARQSRLLFTVMNALYGEDDGTKASKAVAQKPAPNVSERSELTPQSLIELTTGAPLADTTTEPASAVAPIESESSNRTTYAADVLIVEDNHVNLIVAEKMLARLGLPCDSACNGQEGLNKVKEANYQLVLMDGHMPVMDGLRATRAIRRWEAEQFGGKRRIPIVALTANVVQGIRHECKDSGMDDYLSKPITLTAIKQVTQKYVRAQSQETHTELGKDQSDQPRTSAACSLDSSNLQTSPLSEITAPDVTIEARQTVVSKLKAEEPESEAGFAAVVEPTVPNPVREVTTSSEGVDESLVHLERLLEQCCGDNDFAHQILDIMNTSLPDQLRQLEAAQAQGDMSQVAQIAHQVKGAAGDSCLTSVQQTAGAVETLARTDKVELLPHSFQQLREKTELTLESIQTLLDLHK